MMDGSMLKKYARELATYSGNEISVEFHCAIDAYWKRLGCPPPIALLLELPVILSIALLTKAVRLNTPIHEPDYRGKEQPEP